MTSLAPPLGRPALRRLRSGDATPESLAFGGPPAVVVPGHQLNAGVEMSEVASAMELARQQLEGLTQLHPHEGQVKTSVTDKYAFAFDIDGVLIKGGDPIPEAIEALRMLNGHNNRGIKVPHIFLTNGGGKSEAERCLQLSKQLDVEVSPGQFVCGHTPMREKAELYSTVLVIGGEGEKCREVALDYGFKNVVTPGDIIKTQSNVTPFRKLTDEEYKNSRTIDFASTKIEAIFVFADSRDWAGDQQIILDVLTSRNGIIGTRSENYDEGPPLYFAHNDVVWASAHESSRIGMGALRKSVEAMFEAVTGKPLKTTAFGKPQIGTFDFAQRLLQTWRADTHGIDEPPSTVYFVGDTPESDVRGTNEFNETVKETWYSILVKTGVYQDGTTPKYEPKAIVNDVLEAVKHGMERELKKELSDQLNSSPLVEVPNANAR